MGLPKLPLPIPRQETFDNTTPDISKTPDKAHAYVDADWAGDVSHRKSVSGIGILFAGAAVLYKTMYQKVIAMSSTEAKFYSLSGAGKMTLYIRSILDDLGIDQTDATQIFEDKQGCLQLVTAGQTTKRSRHINIREFAIMDWIERHLLNILQID